VSQPSLIERYTMLVLLGFAYGLLLGFMLGWWLA